MKETHGISLVEVVIVLLVLAVAAAVSSPRPAF
jgi:prepilin-type N-terminal cleavage/methylation domain-containing protein